MPSYERFIFESFDLNPSSRLITLRYSLDEIVHFEETFSIPPNVPLQLNHPDLQNALFALHLSGGVSYYKTYCPPIIEVKSGSLAPQQAMFWNTLYTKGLGQFFYENQLDFRGLIKFPVSAPAEPKRSQASLELPSRALVPTGGGKDSLVTTELLRSAGIDQTLLRVRPHAAIRTLASIADLPLLEADRVLSTELFKQNKTGAYNGHIPITAHLSFFSIVLSLLAGFDSVFFSSERSSSYGNIEYLGLEVNHQWSKSLEAETMVRHYLETYVTTEVAYLNVVRPLSELHIAQYFSRYPQYFPAATSCNRNWGLNQATDAASHWCGECPKCAFSFSLLAAFLPSQTVIKMFGQNLFEKSNLLPLFRELWGVEGFKPFECVGTPEEAAAACYLARTKVEFAQAAVITAFDAEVLPHMQNPQDIINLLLTPDWSTSSPVVNSILAKSGIHAH